VLDTRPPLDPVFGAFGVTATVTPTGGGPIATTVIVGSRTANHPPGGEVAVAEHLRLVSLRRDQVPSTPKDTLIVTEQGTFRVDSVVEEDAEVVKVLVR
jgi:hypothetical protein